jgi:hypothetical protein
MVKQTLISLLFLTLWACQGQEKENPAPPEDTGIVGEGDAQAASPGEGGEEQPNVEESPSEPVAGEEDPNADEAGADEAAEEGVQLTVVPVGDLPQRIAECVNQGVAGEVLDGTFTCNEQTLIDCNTDLSNAQKTVAQNYATEQLAGYELYGCSVTAENAPSLHYFMVDGVALRIFNLEVQQSQPASLMGASAGGF